MLGADLKRSKNMELSKSSILPEEADEKKLREMIEDRDHTIRQLSRKIDKLQSNLKKTVPNKSYSNTEYKNSEQHNYLEMLQLQINKSNQLEEIIKEITKRINAILEDITQDNSFTDNTEEIRQMLEELGSAPNQSVSQGQFQDNFQNSFSISKEWSKNVDILQGAIKSFKAKCIGYKQENRSLQFKLDQAHKKIETLATQLKSTESHLKTVESELKSTEQLRGELKEERKQKQKMRGLLERTQLQKNEFMNKINSIGMKEQIKAKTKQELLQYSKELNYRVKDLQKEKEAILKETNKQRETQMKKYQDVLKKLKVIKETSRMGKSFA